MANFLDAAIEIAREAGECDGGKQAEDRRRGTRGQWRQSHRQNENALRQKAERRPAQVVGDPPDHAPRIRLGGRDQLQNLIQPQRTKSGQPREHRGIRGYQ